MKRCSTCQFVNCKCCEYCYGRLYKPKTHVNYKPFFLGVDWASGEDMTSCITNIGYVNVVDTPSRKWIDEIIASKAVTESNVMPELLEDIKHKSEKLASKYIISSAIIIESVVNMIKKYISEGESLDNISVDKIFNDIKDILDGKSHVDELKELKEERLATLACGEPKIYKKKNKQFKNWEHHEFWKK